MSWWLEELRRLYPWLLDAFCMLVLFSSSFVEGVQQLQNSLSQDPTKYWPFAVGQWGLKNYHSPEQDPQSQQICYPLHGNAHRSTAWSLWARAGACFYNHGCSGGNSEVVEDEWVWHMPNQWRPGYQDLSKISSTQTTQKDGAKGKTMKDGAGCRSLAGASEKIASNVHVTSWSSSHSPKQRTQLRFFSPQGSILLIFLGALLQVSPWSTSWDCDIPRSVCASMCIRETLRHHNDKTEKALPGTAWLTWNARLWYKQPQLFKEPLQVRLKLPHILEP